MKKIILPTLLLVASLLFKNPVLAQTSVSITAIPPRLDVTVKPGTSVTEQIKIRNEAATQMNFTTEIRDFIVSDDIGTPIELNGIDESANRWAASSWIQVSPSKVTLKPGETKILSLTVIAPANALAGGHYAMVLHTPDTGVVSINGTGSAVVTRVGTLVYITVPGPITENAQVKEFSVPSFLEYGPVNFRTVITNLSDVHIIPMGGITVNGLFGIRVADLRFPETRIFPLTDRVINSTLTNKWLFGRFTAKLVAAYGTHGQALLSGLTFWVIPWRFLILVAAALIIFIVLMTLVRQKSKEELVQSEEKVDELESELDNLKKKYKDRK